MSEFNFDFLNSLQTPDEWIENALAIPHKSKKSALRRLRPYFIGTAAALIIVSAVVLTLLLNTNGKAPLNKSPEFPVQIPDATVPVDSTGEYSIPQGDPLTTEDSYPADISGDPCAQAPPNENGALPSVTEGAQPHAQPPDKRLRIKASPLRQSYNVPLSFHSCSCWFSPSVND